LARACLPAILSHVVVPQDEILRVAGSSPVQVIPAWSCESRLYDNRLANFIGRAAERIAPTHCPRPNAMKRHPDNTSRERVFHRKNPLWAIRKDLTEREADVLQWVFRFPSVDRSCDEAKSFAYRRTPDRTRFLRSPPARIQPGLLSQNYTLTDCADFSARRHLRTSSRVTVFRTHRPEPLTSCTASDQCIRSHHGQHR
jgi:hypothetical protein